MNRSTSPSKPLAVAAAGITIALTLSGCAGGSSTGATPSGTATITGNTMTFITDQGGPAGDKYKQVIKAFEARYPQYKVNMEVLPGDNTYNSVITSRISSGKSPDLFEIINGPRSAQPFVDANLLRDLSDQPWASKLTPVVKEAAKSYDGHTYGFVSQLDAYGFFYNKDLFKKYGVKVPTSWTELQAAVKTFRDAGVTPIGVGGKDAWPVNQFAWSFAAQQSEFAVGNSEAPKLLDGSKKFSESAGWKSAIDTFSELVKNKSFDPKASGITWPSSATDFDSGKVAMFYQGDFAIPAIRQGKPQFDVGLFTMPYQGDPAPAIVTYGSELAIPTKAPNAGLAQKFLTFLTEKGTYENYLTSAAAFSSIDGMSGKLDPALATIADQVASDAVEGFAGSGLDTATSAALQTGVSSILAGSGSTSDTLAKLDAAQATQ